MKYEFHQFVFWDLVWRAGTLHHFKTSTNPFNIVMFSFMCIIWTTFLFNVYLERIWQKSNVSISWAFYGILGYSAFESNFMHKISVSGVNNLYPYPNAFVQRYWNVNQKSQQVSYVFCFSSFLDNHTEYVLRHLNTTHARKLTCFILIWNMF